MAKSSDSSEQMRAIGNFQLIWLDASFGFSDVSLNAKIRCRAITPYLITFSDISQCWEHILNTEVDYLFVIITDESLVPQASSFAQITFLYVLTPSPSSSIDNDQVRSVFQNENDLLAKLAEDVHLCFDKTTKFNLLELGKSTKNLSRESTKFVWYQYVFEILATVPEPDVAKQEMTTFCRKWYAEDNLELSKISEFERDYCSKNAIKWYTRDSFLYRLLNQVLRSEDIDHMYAFRFILSDLDIQLTELHCNYLETLIELDLVPYTLIVYRGQLMSIQELDRIKRNVLGFISMNTFLSTSSDRHVALIFSGLGEQQTHLKSVLFEIVIETSTCQTAFAEIHNVSWMTTNENEVLITFGAIFQIQSVNENDDHVWVVRLVLCNRDREGIPRLQDLFPEWPIWDQPVDLATLAWCLSEMGNWKRAEDIYKRLMNKSSSTTSSIHWNNLAVASAGHRGIINITETLTQYREALNNTPDLHNYSRVQILMNMAICVLSQGYFEKAQTYLEQSRELLCRDSEESRQHVDVLLLARLYTIIGLLNDQQDRYSEALNYFRQALNIFTGHLSEDNEKCGEIVLYMGATEFKMSNYLEAVLHYQHALAIFSKCYPPEHPVIANCHHLLGAAYFHDGRTIEAQKSLELAFRLRLQADTVHPEDMADSYHCLGQLFNRNNNQKEAIVLFDKTYDIYQACLPEDHGKLAHLFADMGLAYENMGNFKVGMDYLNRALFIELKRSPNSKFLGLIYRNMVSIHVKDGKFKESLEYSEKALIVLESNRPSANEVIASVLNEMAYAYQKLGDYKLALAKYRVAYDIAQTQELSATVSGNIGGLLIELGEYNEAITYLEKGLKLRREYVSDQSALLITFYINLGHAHRELKDYPAAFTYLAQALRNTPAGPPVEKTAEIFDTIASIWYDQGIYEDALSSYQRALNISMNCLRADHPTIAYRLNNLASTYNSMKEYDKAVSLFEKALGIFEYNLPSIHPNIARCTDSIIFAYLKLENYDAVEKHLNRRLILSQALDAEPDSTCIMLYDIFGHIRNAQERYNEALEYLEKIEMFHLTHHNSDLATVFFDKGSVYYNLVRYDMALEYYERALVWTHQVHTFDPKLIDRIRYAIDRVTDHILFSVS